MKTRCSKNSNFTYLFYFFPFIASQSRGKFRCLPDKRPTGVGDGYHGYNSDVSPLANVDEAWRCWLPLFVDGSIEDLSMDGYYDVDGYTQIRVRLTISYIYIELASDFWTSIGSVSMMGEYSERRGTRTRNTSLETLSLTRSRQKVRVKNYQKFQKCFN